MLVRHNRRNNIIGVLKPRRIKSSGYWNATRRLKLLAQLCV